MTLKISYKKTSGCLLIALFFLLTACGGGGGSVADQDNITYSVGGMVTGLNSSIDLVIQSGTTQEVLKVTSDGAFQFNTALSNGSSYTVTVANQAPGQHCTVSNGSGRINQADIISVAVNCVKSSSVKLSGTITPAIGIDYDSDVNDPFAPYTSNNTLEGAQLLANNILNLHGFASAEGLSKYGISGVFADDSDDFDFFQVDLQGNQRVGLQVVDFAFYSSEQLFKGDLDLFLYLYNDNTSEYELVDFSDETGEFEEVTATNSGKYLIVVAAHSGASKYVMQLAPPLSSSSTHSGIDLVAGEMLIKFDQSRYQTTNKMGTPPSVLPTDDSGIVQLKPLSLSHSDYSRPVLAKLPLGSAAKLRTTNKQQTNSHNPVFDSASMHTLKAIKQWSMQPGVEYAEPNYRVHPLTIPNDNAYPFQWHYPLIKLPQAWDITTGTTAGDPVIVAVIDTGVFLDHVELQGKLTAGYDFITDTTVSRDGDGLDANPDDPGDEPQRGRSSWHGTHVAGTVGALTNNNAGLAGVSWGAQIMPIRVLGYGGGTVAQTIEGFRYAAGLSNSSGTLPSTPADVINLSLGGYGYSQAMQDAVTEARNAGIIVIAAAGNENTDQQSYPASYEGVVSVSAVKIDKNKASYSNYGISIDVAAPGGDVSEDQNGDGYADGVLSIVADDTTGVRESSMYFHQGTSMAAPHVAGVAALMRAVYPGLSPAEFDQLLQSGSVTEDLGSSGRDDIFGFGLIDAYLAVIEAQRLANGGISTEQPAKLSAAPNSLALGNSNNASFVLSNIGGDSNLGEITFSDIPDWISITPTNVENNGLGEYRVLVDRSNLGNGTYQARVVINYVRSGEADRIILDVTMEVGMISSSGRINSQFVVLIHADTLETVATVKAENRNGNLLYSFDNVSSGTYFIFSGTDVDYDAFLCQSGESCGSYPSLSESEVVTVSSTDLSNLDIVVNILGGLDIGTLSDSPEYSYRQGIQRTAPKLSKAIKDSQLESIP